MQSDDQTVPMPSQLRSILILPAALVVGTLLLASSASGAPGYKVLHAFGKGQDGAGTWGSLLLDKRGNLYGATSGGGVYGYGTAFELRPRSNGKWSETILHSFDWNGEDGYESHGGLTFDEAGNLFGTTTRGGIYKYGTVFELTPNSSGGWVEKVIFSFDLTDGGGPYGGVTMNQNSGVLYGTAGFVFELASGSDGWTERVIDHFARRSDGNSPFAGVILDTNGNLYGTTEYGGVHSAGVVYELSPKTGGGWQEHILYDFCPAGPPHCEDGATPGLGVLAMDNSGDLYGTTSGGGCCGGTVFRLAPRAGGHWQHRVLYEFKGGWRGEGPGAGVVRDGAGNLYGTTVYGGKYGNGVVYELSPQKSGRWRYTVLHAFAYSDGAQPDANLILDDKGNLYGTAATGGEYGNGIVFEVTP
jgi:uncharacterized repeat protein (TIGR03803 family)